MLIKPIILYGAEVWGTHFFKFLNNQNILKIILLVVKNVLEKLHSKVCKYILQLHKRAENYAVRCELGRYPLMVDVICRMLKYYVNIRDREDSSSVKFALMLQQRNNGLWYKCITYIVEYNGMDINKLNNNCITSSKGSLRMKLINVCEKLYMEKIKESKKLELYQSVKTVWKKERYLKVVNNAKLRKYVCQLRLSCHKLPIEVGRYIGLKREDRLCKYCKLYIGSENHCIMKCFHPELAELRNKFLETIFNINNMLSQFPRDDMFKYLMLFNDANIITPTALYISKVLHKFL
jgi:hypothetical protein